MAFVIADRVRETTTTTGTGNLTLDGAVSKFRTFASVLSSSDTTYYSIVEQTGTAWEVGIGTFTSPATLARTTILSSSSGGSAVNFGAGTKDVFISLPASKTNTNDQPNVISVNSTSNALRITQTGTGNALVVEDSANPDSSPFVVDASGNVGIGTTTPTALLDVNGSVAITGTARRITGDFSNGTFSSRVTFQSSTTNGVTGIQAVPNGTSQTATFDVYNAADPTNASFGQLQINASDVRLVSNLRGTGTYLPMTFYTGGSERMRVDTSGNVGIGTNSPSKKLDIFNSGTTTTDLVVRNGTVSSLSFVDSGAGYTGTSTNHPFLFTTNGTERMRLDTSGNLLFNSGYGSVATAYGCRAWVNFNGTGTVAIRASGNVSSITDNGVGAYTINFTNTMPDANYMLAGCHEDTGSSSGTVGLRTTTITTSAISIFTNTGTSYGDATYVHAAIFR